MIYSQNNEQEVLLSILPKTGRFLDIGAFHPTQLSNTRALYEMGWSGVMVEPSPGPMLSLLREYGNDERIKLIQAAVEAVDSHFAGLTQLHVTDDAVSTSSESVRRTWERDGGYYGRVLVPIMSVKNLELTFGPFDFIDIDAEGQSADIFKAMLGIGSCRPICFCVEHDSREAEITKAAAKTGYSVAAANGENIIFRRGV